MFALIVFTMAINAIAFAACIRATVDCFDTREYFVAFVMFVLGWANAAYFLYFLFKLA